MSDDVLIRLTADECTDLLATLLWAADATKVEDLSRLAEAWPALESAAQKLYRGLFVIHLDRALAREGGGDGERAR